MFVVVYWWRVKPGKEGQSRDAWRRGTREIARIYGGLGSRLHREADFVAIAEWPEGNKPVFTMELTDDLLARSGRLDLSSPPPSE